MKKLFLMIIGLSVFFEYTSATNEIKDVNPNLTIDYITQKKLSLKAKKLVDRIEYIKLETTPDCLLGMVRKVEIFDHKIFIQDERGSMYVFAEDGHFLRKIGKVGSNKESYRGMIDFFLDREHKWVCIMDAGGARLVYYDFDGNYVKDILFKNKRFWYCLASASYKGSLLVYSNCYYKIPYSVGIYDAETMVAKKFLNPYPMNKMANCVWTHHPFAETSEGVTFIKPFSDTLFQFDGVSVKPRFVVEPPFPLAPQEFYDTYRAEIDSIENVTFGSLLVRLKKANYFTGIWQIYETRDHLYISYNLGWSLLWDKRVKKGAYFDRYNIIGAADDYFISISPGALIPTNDPSPIDPDVKVWGQNNPVLSLLYMKKRH